MPRQTKISGEVRCSARNFVNVDTSGVVNSCRTVSPQQLTVGRQIAFQQLLQQWRQLNMASGPIRDPKTDDLLTPQNSALVIIDYQPLQVNSIASMDRNQLVNHIVAVAKTGVGYGLPIVHSTVNVKTGWNK